MKEYFYISGLPRSGNTLLSTILNENPNIHATGHSFVPDLLFAIQNAENNSNRFKSYPCHNNLNNVYKNIIPNYYKDYNVKYIIERGDWITPYNIKVLKKIVPNKIKIVILIRDVLEIIKSFLKLCQDNPEFYINKDYNFLDHTTLFTDEIETKVDLIMAKNNYVNTILFSIHQLKKNNLLKDFLLIDYNDLVKKPKITLDKIYNYYGIDLFKHSFNNFKKKLEYNDSIFGGLMHEIRTDKIKKNNNDIKLSENIINKYKHLNNIIFKS
jgi:sulfotransferase